MLRRCAVAIALLVAFANPARATDAPARRIVSMNPSLTRILVAIGAADALVGVDAFSARAEPAVASLPRVGGLYSPSLESVVELQPDLVVIVPSFEQREFRTRLEALKLRVEDFDPVSFEQVLDTISALGARTGHETEAKARVDAIRRTRDTVRRATAELPRPRSVLILQREPLFVAGRGTFIDDMIAIAGGENLGAELAETWPRTSAEWLVGVAPEVILDSDSDPAPAATVWARWPSLPAVAKHRVVAVDAGDVTLPGPDLDRALVKLARALHGEALDLPEIPR
jgi:ABC-type Fe3+-hydroxamate transport system substrate-binding protein